MNSNGVVYRCNKSCPIGKRCFILKTAVTLKEPITVWHKCVAKKEDSGHNRWKATALML